LTQRERRERQLFEAGDEEIGVAQAAGFHAEQNFAGGGFGEVQRFDGDGSAGMGEDGGSGVGTAHGEEYNEIHGWQAGGLLLAIFQNALNIPLAMQNGHHLHRSGFRPVNDGVVGVSRERPKPKRSLRQILAGMTTRR